MNIHETAKAWLLDPRRPRVSPGVQRQWEQLLEEWVDRNDMPLLIRKSTLNRGALYTHPSGRTIVPTDNSPAHWSLSTAITGQTPTIEEVFDALRNGKLPVAFALKAAEKPLAVYNGTLSRMGAPSLSRQDFKVCHIDPVASVHRRRLDQIDLASLKAEMKRFLSPSNMFVVHLKVGPTTGLGEQLDFIKVFREAAQLGGGG